MKVKVRGIYSTALTQILTERGIEVVQPSKKMVERFSIENNDSAANIIYDKEDMNGITISGSNARELADIINERLQDSAVRVQEFGDIYCGKIKNTDARTGNILIDLGNSEEGLLSIQSYWGMMKEGEKILVQVKGKLGNKKLLSTKLRIFGENAILIKDGFTKISKHIKSESEKQKLERLGEELKSENWGVLWKAFSEGKPEDELKNELVKLYEEEAFIRKNFEEKSEPEKIKDGICVFFIDFGALSKMELDNSRKKVLTTIPGHHFLKSGDYSLLVDFAEALENIDYDVIAGKINNAIMKNGPMPGAYYKIIQKKPNGRDIIFSGYVEGVNKDEIVIKRNLRPGGRLDGIGGEIKRGDYSITKFKPNSWVVQHNYFDKGGIAKGVYYNINTPVEAYPSFARYIDLEVDVVEKGGKMEIIDLEKLERVTNEKIIKESLAKKAIEIANQIVKGEKNDSR